MPISATCSVVVGLVLPSGQVPLHMRRIHQGEAVEVAMRGQHVNSRSGLNVPFGHCGEYRPLVLIHAIPLRAASKSWVDNISSCIKAQSKSWMQKSTKNLGVSGLC